MLSQNSSNPSSLHSLPHSINQLPEKKLQNCCIIIISTFMAQTSLKCIQKPRYFVKRDFYLVVPLKKWIEKKTKGKEITIEEKQKNKKAVSFLIDNYYDLKRAAIRENRTADEEKFSALEAKYSALYGSLK
mgnify:CR=1 FL=1